MIKRFALVVSDPERGGLLVVENVIVATQEFVDSAPSEWADQWDHVVDVTDKACDMGWIYNRTLRSFSPEGG